jgi:hypothetical protein
LSCRKTDGVCIRGCAEGWTNTKCNKGIGISENSKYLWIYVKHQNMWHFNISHGHFSHNYSTYDIYVQITQRTIYM